MTAQPTLPDASGHFGPFGGVETDGVKDVAKIRAFIAAVRQGGG